MNKTSKQSVKWARLLIIAAVIVFLVVGTLLTRDSTHSQQQYGLSRSAVNDSYTYSSKEMPAEADSVVMSKMTAGAGDADTFAEAAEDSAENGAQGEKIIRTASVSLKTTAFESVLSSLRVMATEVGGRVESLSVYGEAADSARWGYLSLRIPSDKLDNFLASAEGLGQVTGYSEYARDVSDTYYDISARLTLQQAKLEKLQAMLPQATTVSEIVEIESAISETQYYIDQYQGRLNGLDAQIDYSTVTIDINEVKEAEPEQEPTFFERIGTALKNSLQGGVLFLRDMLVFIVAALPWLAAAGVVTLAVVLIIRKAKKQRPEQE